MQTTPDSIPAPQPTTPDQPAPVTPTTASAPPPAAPSSSTLSTDFNRHQGLGGNDVIVGVGVSIVLAVIFWFVGRVLTDTLVKQFAEVGSAKRAGLMLFLFLSVTATFATFGFLGNFWLALYFLIPAGVLGVLLLFMFLFSLIAAFRSKRR